MAKKDLHREAVQKGLEKLRQAGIATDNLSSVSVSLLQDQLGKGHETDLAVIFLLGRIVDAAALDVLTPLEKTTADKEIRKEVRRSLFKLAQKGLRAPPSRDEGVSVHRPVIKLAPEIEGYLSSVDGGGGRLVWLARPQAGSGIQLLQGMVSDREGLVQAGGTLIRRKELRRMAKDIKEKHGVTMISIPWEYGDLIIYEGFDKAKALGRSGLEEFSSLRAGFNPAKPKPLPHPIYSRLSSDESGAGAWRDLSRRLLDEAEFRPWVLDEDWMKPYLGQVEEAQGSRLVLNQLQKEERFASIVRDAVREIFFGANRPIFQRRMEDMALYLLATKREEAAQLALAVALQLAEGDPGIFDISFLTGLVQKSVALYLSQEKEQAAEEPSLIVKP